MRGGRQPGLKVDGLPAGGYRLEFTGTGYAAFAVPVTLDRYAQHVTLGTGDGTFSLGDLDGDGRVTEADRSALAGALGSRVQADLDAYDLNGDTEINIVDLAYVSHQTGAAGEAQVSDTLCLSVPVELERLRTELAAVYTEITEGTPGDLFRENTEAVTFRRSNGGKIGEQAPLLLPIALTEPVETSEVHIVTPENGSQVLAGKLTVEAQDGSVEVYSFDYSVPEGVYAMSRTPGTSVITISLGRRVAVKKITVSVTKTAENEFAAIETIRFLKDIVPENPVAPNSTIEGLTAVAEAGQVRLSWRPLPNLSGYRVDYWEAEKENAPRQSLRVDTAQAVVSGLESRSYGFTVTPIDGSWEGKSSAPVFATPLFTGVPDRPDMVSVTAGDGVLNISWKAGKAAEYYEVYYTSQADAPVSSYQLAGEPVTENKLTLTGLENGVTYYLYVVAGNTLGKSAPSQVHSGTPAAVDYSRPEGIPEGTLDYTAIEKVWLTASYNYSPTAYPADKPFQPEFMYDGDFSTHWTSHSYGDGNWWNDKQIQCTFKEPQDLSAVIWVPRLDGGYAGNLRTYTISVWTQWQDLNGPGTLVAPNPDWTGLDTGNANNWPGVRNNPSVTRFAVLPFDPVKDVVKIAVRIEQKAYTAVSLSELMFMPYREDRNLDALTDALFADELCTTLRADVTQEEIDGLKARLDSEGSYYLYPAALADQLALAEELLQGQTPGVLLNGIESRSGGPDSTRYQQGGSVLQPLGAAAQGGSEITVYASGIPEGESVTLWATQFNAEVSAWKAQVGTIQNGRNVLVVPKIGSGTTGRGGSLYLTYGGSAPENIRLHVRRAVDIPMVNLSGWYGMEEADRRSLLQSYVAELDAYLAQSALSSGDQTANCLNVTEVATPTVLLSLPAAAVSGGAGKGSTEQRADTLYNSILAWEDVMHICKTTQGIANTYESNDMQTRQNIRCMTMFAGAFMYAAGDHVGIGYGSCSGMAAGKPVSQMEAGASANRLFGWGIAHEIGHNMDKLGRAEITNNIYSLMVQTYDGAQNTLPSRLERSNKYAAIFNKVAQGYPGASNDVFVQLGMYWQLHLAYDTGSDPMDFYHRFFQAWKAGTYFDGASAYDDKVALTAAGVAGRDLSEFFLRWGMTLSESTRNTLASYPGEDRAVWYLNDDSRRDALAGAPEGAGTVAVEAGLQNNNEIVLNITPSITGGIQGYEIRRNGTPVAFTTKTTYVDIVGQGNHRTYEYSVAAYDTLGNEICTGRAGQVRVAYDKLVDAGAYQAVREGDYVVFTFTQPTPVSGLKLTGTNPPADGLYKVDIETSVTGADGTEVLRSVTACEGSFDAGNLATDGAYLVYFNKPGSAGTGDTRIWTYDARTITVEGIPAEMPLEDVRLVAYAEDDIAFLDGGLILDETTGTSASAGGCVGRLAAPLEVEEGVTLPAGTLVVAGTYRGDPLFCTIKLKGRFTVTTIGEDGEVLEQEKIGRAHV